MREVLPEGEEQGRSAWRGTGEDFSAMATPSENVPVGGEVSEL